MPIIKLTNAKIYDPIQGKNGILEDLFIQHGRLIPPQTPIHLEYDLQGKVVMAGGIDLHTHIGSAQVNLARILLPSYSGPPLIPPVRDIGYRYAEMGYTHVVEPALFPCNARQTYAALQSIPILDKSTFVLVGQDEFLLNLLRNQAPQTQLNDYIAWLVNSTAAIGVKIVNPGNVPAFQFHQRPLELDEINPHCGITPRQILTRIAQTVAELQLPHPLHLHACNLGMPGNITTTLNTLAALEGWPVHLTHIQFHSYGQEGPQGFSSGALQLVTQLHQHPEITVDVGQLLFGQTITLSADTQAQFQHRSQSYPRHHWAHWNFEGQGGCGILPFRYRNQNFINALQWVIGLEIFLLLENPWQVVLTTDSPNGAPFTSYPHLIRLLMDAPFRAEKLAELPPLVVENSLLKELKREYSLYEIAILTRSAPARLLNCKDKGHLGIGAIADLVVYTEQTDKEAMFSQPDYVFKRGECVVKRGQIIQTVAGSVWMAEPNFDPHIERQLAAHFSQHHSLRLDNFKLSSNERARLSHPKPDHY